MIAVVKKIAKRTASKGKAAAAKKSKKKLTPEDIQQLIAKKAYELYTKRGNTHGDDWSDWYEAEKAVMKKIK